MTPETLGRMAASCDLLAADTEYPMDREYFAARAAHYRAKQYAMLDRDYPLATILPDRKNVSHRPGVFQSWHDQLLRTIIVAACIGAALIYTLYIVVAR